MTIVPFARLWHSIRGRLMVSAVVMVLMLSAVNVLDTLVVGRQFLIEEETAQATSLARNLAFASAAAVHRRDFPAMADHLHAFRHHEEIDYIMLVSPEGQILAHSDEERVGRTLTDALSRDMLAGPAGTRTLLVDGRRIDVVAPVVLGDRMIGWARVGYSLVHVDRGNAKSMLRAGIYLLVALVLGVLAAWWFARRMTASLYDLLGTMARIRGGDHTVRAAIIGLDEQDRLVAGLNEMLDVLGQSESRAAYSETRLRLASSAAGIDLMEVDLQHGSIEYSKEWMQRLGYAEGEGPGSSLAQWLPFIHPQDQARFEGLRLNPEAWPAAGGGFRLRAKDGRYRWILVRGEFLADSEGKLSRFLGALSDFTESVEVQDRLRESEQRFRSIASNVPGMVFQLRLLPQGGEFTYVSGGVRELCERQPEELLELDDLVSMMHDDDREYFLWWAENSRLTQEPVNAEFRLQVGREMKWVNLRAATRTQDGSVYWDGVVLNITETRQSAEELKRSRDEVRELTRHEEAVREEEKARIAREIHDELGATLTALKMDAFWLERRAPDVPPPHAEKLRQMQELINQAVQTTRRISTELRPRVIDDLGIVAGLEWLIGEFRRHRGTDCRFAASPAHIDLDGPRSIALFRIVQESLTNIAKHAQASSVLVELKEEGRDIMLRIQDDGRGVVLAEAGGKSLSHGLRGMLERAHQLGGTLSIGRGGGGGTVVTVRIPREGVQREKGQRVEVLKP